MKHLGLLIGIGIAASGNWTGSAEASELRTPAFYNFAQKSAELYRGQLFSRPEIEIFVSEIGRQAKTASPLLQAFRATPYDVDATASMLRWLEDQCRENSCDKMQAFKDRLELHYNQLRQIAEIYEG